MVAVEDKLVSSDRLATVRADDRSGRSALKALAADIDGVLHKVCPLTEAFRDVAQI